jgi:hypothetical protein
LPVNVIEGGKLKMSKRDKDGASNRRDFLRLAGLGTVAGGTALVSGVKPAEATGLRADGSQGYRQSEHDKTYNPLAKFYPQEKPAGWPVSARALKNNPD